MVYCTKCGTKNEDDVAYCTKCGEPLNPTRAERIRYHRRRENECFGIPNGGLIVGMVIGIIIVLWGLIWIMQQTGLISAEISVWPFAIILFGLLMVIGAIFRLQRRY